MFLLTPALPMTGYPFTVFSLTHHRFRLRNRNQLWSFCRNRINWLWSSFRNYIYWLWNSFRNWIRKNRRQNRCFSRAGSISTTIRFFSGKLHSIWINLLPPWREPSIRRCNRVSLSIWTHCPSPWRGKTPSLKIIKSVFWQQYADDNLQLADEEYHTLGNPATASSVQTAHTFTEVTLWAIRSSLKSYLMMFICTSNCLWEATLDSKCCRRNRWWKC